MRFNFLVLTLFLLYSSLSFSQPKDSLIFALEIQEKSLLEGECTILTGSVYANLNSENIRFTDLANQLINIKSDLWKIFFFTGRDKTDRIFSESVDVNGVSYKRYQLIEFGICPTKSLTIPTFDLYMLNLHDSSNIYLKSKEVTLDIKKLDENLNPDALYPIPVGFLSLDEKIDTASYKKNGSFLYEMNFSGSACTFFIEPAVKENKDFTYTKINENYKDTVLNKIFVSRKSITYSIKPTTNDSIFLNDYFSLCYLSKKNNSIDTLASNLKISFQPKNSKHNLLPINFNPRRVILVDVSESMDIEDYYPTRYYFAKDLVNELNKDLCAKIFMYSGKVIEVKGCSINNYNTLSKEKGTALGDALWSAYNYLSETDNGEIIVIGDGDTTTGNISEFLVTDLISKQNIKINTIGIGNSGKVPFGTDFFGNKRYIENTYNEKSLKQISLRSNGFFLHIEPKDSISSSALKILKLLED